jgi:hypothetical protein
MLIIFLLLILNFLNASEFYGDAESADSLPSIILPTQAAVEPNQALSQSFDRAVSIAGMFNSYRDMHSFDDSLNYRIQRRNLSFLLTTFRFFPSLIENFFPQDAASFDIEPIEQVAVEMRDRITNEDDLRFFSTQNLSLLCEEPNRFYEQILQNYRRQISAGRLFVTRQEVMNWIYAQIAVTRDVANTEADLPITDKLFADIVHLTSTRPYVVQINTFNQLRRNSSRLPNLGHLVNECVNYGLIDSFKYWQSRNFAVKDYNNLLAEGDLVLSPFAHGDQCYATADDGLQFLQLQNINFAALNGRQRELLSNSYVSCTDLVSIINDDK